MTVDVSFLVLFDILGRARGASCTLCAWEVYSDVGLGDCEAAMERHGWSHVDGRGGGKAGAAPSSRLDAGERVAGGSPVKGRPQGDAAQPLTAGRAPAGSPAPGQEAG